MIGGAAVLALTVIASALATDAAYAQGAYCAVNGGRDGYENCGYFTFNQCRAAVSGVGGFCIPNPRAVRRFDSDEAPAPPPPYRYHRGW
jgi:hypothetical protein